MPQRSANDGRNDPRGRPAALRSSALSASALRRMAVVCVPIALLWITVAFALDLVA